MNMLTSFQAAGEGRPEDVLERHHKNNGRPSAPNPALLAHPSQPATASKVRAPRNSKKLKDATPSPDNLGFYHATWKDCLEDAKKECRAAHALDNPFPSKARDLNTSITESLVTVVVEWTERGTAFEPGASIVVSRQNTTHSELGFWPEHKRNMAIVVSCTNTTAYSLTFYLPASQRPFHVALRAEEGRHCPRSDIVWPCSPRRHPISRTCCVDRERRIKPSRTIRVPAQWL